MAKKAKKLRVGKELDFKILFSIVLFFLIIFLSLFFYLGDVFVSCAKNDSNSYSKVIPVMISLDDEFLEILATDSDGLEYLDYYNNTYVVSYNKFNSSEVSSLREVFEFPELFDDLPEKELYKVDFKSDESKISLVSIIDLDSKEVVKVRGIYLLEVSS